MFFVGGHSTYNVQVPSLLLKCNEELHEKHLHFIQRVLIETYHLLSMKARTTFPMTAMVTIAMKSGLRLLLHGT